MKNIQRLLKFQYRLQVLQYITSITILANISMISHNETFYAYLNENMKMDEIELHHSDPCNCGLYPQPLVKLHFVKSVF